MIIWITLHLLRGNPSEVRETRRRTIIRIESLPISVTLPLYMKEQVYGAIRMREVPPPIATGGFIAFL
jgi:hypothetical protein